MKLDTHVVSVIAKRDFRGYFASPTGYVFITLFILLSAAAAFWQEEFFANNLANLDQLNDLFPLILLFFIPALTMNVWSDERRKGTDELLLTIPASDFEITLGKYLGVLGIYSISLLLSLSHVLVLLWLGRPDLGLMFGNYLGYWLAGAALIGVGMVASLLVSNVTIGFVLGALFCSVFVLISSPLLGFSDFIRSVLSPAGIADHFLDFARGVISVSGLAYFTSIAATSLYINVLLLSRRHWPQMVEGQRFALHQLIRVVAVVIAVAAFNVVLARPAIRLDTTAEHIHSLSDETRRIINELPSERPVLVNAYVSSEVPRAYVETRESVLSTLREIAAIGGSRIKVQIHDVQPFSDEAKAAREKYGIVPREIVAQESARNGSFQVYMGVAFASGPRQEVIPFFDRGLPVEYELARSVRVVANAQRKRVGVLTTDVNLFGGFDFQNMSQTPPWSVVQELRKQYDVVRVSPDSPIKDSVDALLAVMPSTLTQPQLDNLKAYVLDGHPTMLLDDPLPVVNISWSPVLPAGAQTNPFMQQQQQPQKQKGDVAAFFREIGINWNPSQVVWDTYNPHREILQTPPEIIFAAQNANNAEAFSQDNEITRGLQEMVLLYPGYVYKAVDSKFELQPLIRTSHVSGMLPWDQLIQRGFFGATINRNPRRVPSEESYILAAQVKGDAPTGIDPSSGRESERHCGGRCRFHLGAVLPDQGAGDRKFKF